jgi:DNA-binding response OmpR family regulator
VQKTGYIVIVETDDLIRELLERWLGEAGYAVVTAAAGVPVQERPVRLVIVNISSPRGAERLIQSLQASYMAPILVISARFRRGLEGSADAAQQLDVRKVLPKPFTRAELLAAVRESIEDP